jgi:hypothetical protein
MSFNLTYRYLLPRMRDNEGNQISVVLSSVPAGVVKFSEIECCSGEEGEEYIELWPKDWRWFGNYELEVVLTDGNKESPGHKFKLSMTNTAPYL